MIGRFRTTSFDAGGGPCCKRTRNQRRPSAAVQPGSISTNPCASLALTPLQDKHPAPHHRPLPRGPPRIPTNQPTPFEAGPAACRHDSGACNTLRPGHQSQSTRARPLRESTPSSHPPSIRRYPDDRAGGLRRAQDPGHLAEPVPPRGDVTGTNYRSAAKNKSSSIVARPAFRSSSSKHERSRAIETKRDPVHTTRSSSSFFTLRGAAPKSRL